MRVVTTDHATHFYDINEVPVRVYTDKDEWEVSFAFKGEEILFHCKQQLCICILSCCGVYISIQTGLIRGF